MTLELFALRDISKDGLDAHRLAVFINDTAIGFQGHPAAVLGNRFRFIRRVIPSGKILCDYTTGQVGIFGSYDLSQVHSQDFLARVPQDGFACPIERGKVSVQVSGAHDIIRILEQLAVALFALPQCLLRFGSKGDVLHDGHRATDLARRVIGRRDKYHGQEPGTILPLFDLLGHDHFPLRETCLSLPVLFPRFFRNDREGLPEHLLLAPAKHVLRRRVPCLDVSLRIQSHDHQWGGLHQGRQFLIRFPQSRLRAP